MGRRSLQALCALAFLAAAAFAARRAGLLGAAGIPRWPLTASVERGNLHASSIDEYHYFYKDDGEFPLFSWIYAGFLTDEKGAEYRFCLAYYAEKSSYYPGVMLLLRPLGPAPAGAAPPREAVWGARRPRLSERPGSVRFESGSPEKGFRIDVDAARHVLRAWAGKDFELELSFDRMDPAFMLNRGAPVEFRSGARILAIDDFLSGEGRLRSGGRRSAVRALVAHERTYSREDQWQFDAGDWLCVFHEDFYALLFTLGDRGRPGGAAWLKDGFVYFRKEKDYVPLRRMEIRDLDTRPVEVVKGGKRIRMEAPRALRVEASGRDLRLGFLFERIGEPYGRELAMRGSGFLERGGRRTDYASVRAWEEFMR